MPQSQKPVVAVAMVAAALGAILGSVAVNRVFSPGRGLTVEKTLVQATEAINKNLPMMVDSDTRLNSTAPCPDKTILYRYTLVNLARNPGFDLQVFVASVRPAILNQYRTNDGMKSFRDSGVTMRYEYSDRNGVFLAEVVVGPKDLR